jgi:hypothetical protein
MTAFHSRPKPDGAACCRDIAATMIGHLTTRLEVEAAKAGGQLSAEAIRAIAERFVATEQDRFAAVFQRSYDACSQAREAQSLAAGRSRPFDRLLIRKFAHLFPARRGDDGGSGVLSRRLIPGFHFTVGKMIGPTLYEQCQRKSQAICDRHRRSGGGYDWEAVHADAEAVALVDDVLVVVAHSFADFDRRRAWFLDLVNGRLGPPGPDAADAQWRLSDFGFDELMLALFADLAAAVAGHPENVRARYGGGTFEALRQFLARLQKA